MRRSIVQVAALIATAISILAATSAAAAQQKRDLSGRWTGTFHRNGTAVTLVLNLQSSDSYVTGVLVDPGGNQMPIQEWKIEGTQLTFAVLAKEHGHSRTDHFIGVVEGDLIKLLQRNAQKYDPPIAFHRDAQ
jgi:hypothetical protein